MTFEIICQIMIPILSCAGVFFVTKKTKARRWGFVLGLCSQPFWLYTTVHNHQWGLFLLALFYTTQWIKGIYTHWFDFMTPEWYLRHQWWCCFKQIKIGRECADYDGVCWNCQKDRVTGKVI